MNSIYCKKETSLTVQEKNSFVDHLTEQEITTDIFDVFDEWVMKSSEKVCFFYLKVFQDDELIGIGLFLKVKPFDMRTSYSGVRKQALLNKIFSAISTLSNNCVYISFRNLITSNITRPFFYKSLEMEGTVMKAILDYLKKEKDADMVSVLDTSVNDAYYKDAGYLTFPSSSEAFFDVTRYSDISEYLNQHKSLKKNLKRRKNLITTEVKQGPISGIDRDQMKECVDVSVSESRVNTPSQQFFEDNIFESEVFTSDKYVHICIRVDDKIVGFHIYHISGSIMGGILGGFNRKLAQKSFAYERVIVASLDYAIQNNLHRVNYSLVDNYTKLRLVDCLEPCNLYFYSRNPMNRLVFKSTFKFSDMYELYQLEKKGA